MSGTLMKCADCGRLHSKSATACPGCGRPIKKRASALRRVLQVITGVGALACLVLGLTADARFLSGAMLLGIFFGLLCVDRAV